MQTEEALDFQKFVSAYQAAQFLDASQLALIRRAYSAFSFFGKDLDKIWQEQAEYFRSVSFSLPYSTSKIKQYISEAFDTAALVHQIADIVREQNLCKISNLTKVINDSFSESLTHIGPPSYDEEVNRFVSALEQAAPYIPENVNQEIKEAVIKPAKKKQLSIDTLISIVGIVLTILIFVFEQASDYIAQHEEEKDLNSLRQSNQQLSEEIDDLGRTIQQLTDEVSKLSGCLDNSRDFSLDEKNSDCEKTDTDSLEQIDNSQ